MVRLGPSQRPFLPFFIGNDEEKIVESELKPHRVCVPFTLHESQQAGSLQLEDRNDERER